MPSVFPALLISLLLHGAALWLTTPSPPPAAPSPAPLTATLIQSVEPDVLLKNTLFEENAPPPPIKKLTKSTHPIGTTTATARIRQAQRKLSPHLYYPREAVDHGWEGEVRLLLMLDATGTILHVEIAAGSGHALLDRAAVRAVQSMRQIPNAGVREMILPVTFQLQ